MPLHPSICTLKIRVFRFRYFTCRRRLFYRLDFQHFSPPDRVLTYRLLTLCPLALLIHRATLHDSLHDLAGINVLECMSRYLVEDSELFRGYVGVIGKRNERRGAVIDC